MNRIESFFARHWQALPACLMAALFVYYNTLHSGIGISPDSVVYSSVADNLKNHFAANDFNGLPMVDFPLGYPGLLALIASVTKTSVLKMAPVLNAVLFCITILLTSIVLNRYTKQSAFYKLLLLLLFACCPCLLEVYAMLWSETLFICWVLLFLILAHNYLQTQSIRNLLWMGVCCSFAMITRYAGISLIFTGGLLVIFHGEATWKQKINHLFLFGFIAALLPALNLIRNIYIHNSFTGVREKALRSFWENLDGMAAVFAEWFPFSAHAKLAFIVVVLLLLGTLCFFVFRILQQQFYTQMGTVVACFVLVYLSFMLFIASVSRFEELSSRLLSPAYIPVLIAGTHWMIPFIQGRLRKWKPWFVMAALALYGALIYHQYKLNAEAWEGIKDAGMPGYAEDSWTQSPIISYFKKEKPVYTYPVYANANDALYFLTGLYAQPLPHKEIQQEIDRLLQKPAFYLVWFNDGVNEDLIGLDYIRQRRKLSEVKEFENGAIYLFTPAQ